MSKTAKDKILSYLSKQTGYNTLTAAQARARFGINNVAARIQELRDEGHCIYTNSKTLEDGRKINFYRLGAPTKKIVGAGIRALRRETDRTFA